MIIIPNRCRSYKSNRDINLFFLRCSYHHTFWPIAFSECDAKVFFDFSVHALKDLTDIFTGESVLSVPSPTESSLCGTHMAKRFHSSSISESVLNKSLEVSQGTARFYTVDWTRHHGVMETAPLLMFLYYLHLFSNQETPSRHPKHRKAIPPNSCNSENKVSHYWLGGPHPRLPQIIYKIFHLSIYTSLTSESGHFNDPFLRLNADRTIFISFHRCSHSEIQTRPSAALQGLTLANKCMRCTETKKYRACARKRWCERAKEAAELKIFFFSQTLDSTFRFCFLFTYTAASQRTLSLFPPLWIPNEKDRGKGN